MAIDELMAVMDCNPVKALFEIAGRCQKQVENNNKNLSLDIDALLTNDFEMEHIGRQLVDAFQERDRRNLKYLRLACSVYSELAKYQFAKKKPIDPEEMPHSHVEIKVVSPKSD